MSALPDGAVGRADAGRADRRKESPFVSVGRTLKKDPGQPEPDQTSHIALDLVAALSTPFSTKSGPRRGEKNQDHAWSDLWLVTEGKALKAYQTNAQSSWITALQILAVLWVLCLLPPAVLLLVVADSWRGCCFAILALLVAVIPLATTIAWIKKSKRWWAGIGGAAFGALVLMVGSLSFAPSGHAGLESRVSNEYFEGAGFRRFALSNLVPEGDQLLAIFTLMPMVDQLFTAKQARELKALTSSLYRELESDRDFRALGSDMQSAYDDFLVGPASGTHAFVYIPVGLNRREPRPVLVFFHGSGGNFKTYTRILSKLADQFSFVLVAPSGGAGNWTSEDSQRCLEVSLAAAERRAKIDHESIYVMGLSNGGKAVSQLAQRQGAKFRSLIYISPVFDDETIGSSAFVNQCQGRSILVISGDRDDRVPIYYVEDNVRKMVGAGLHAELKTLSDADHFLMFSHRSQMVQILSAHIAAQSSSKESRP